MSGSSARDCFAALAMTGSVERGALLNSHYSSYKQVYYESVLVIAKKQSRSAVPLHVIASLRW
jgi:hypothetical protein